MPHKQSQNSYLAGVRQWKLRNMVEEYLRARQVYQKVTKARSRNGRLPTFEVLRKISDRLFEIKEAHHLVFRRSDELEKGNGLHKFVPGYSESTFIDHVGLLFHKLMVARELRYILQRYAYDEKNWEANFNELERNLERIGELFEEGVTIIKDVIRSHADNVLLMAFLMENARWVANCLQIKSSEMLAELVDDSKPHQLYHSVAAYYFESGWYDQAEMMLKKALGETPDYEPAIALMQDLKKKRQKNLSIPKKQIQTSSELNAATL